MLAIKFKKIIFCIIAGISFLASCTKSDLAKINTVNTNLSNLSTAPPAALFLQATNATQSSVEYFYDLNRFIFPLSQIFTNSATGVTKNTLTDGNSISNRYYNFFNPNGTGNYCTDAERQFYVYYTADEQSVRVSWVPIFRILKAYYAFYVSDVYGSIAYTQAFKGKEGIFKPVYDTQEALFDTLDMQLKNAVATLKTATNDQLLGQYDLYYGGDPTHWIKAANSLRLKIAMRLMKRNPTKLASIASEVMSDNVGLMSNNNDSWLLVPLASYFGGSGGNWDPTSVTAKGIKGTIDFMWNNTDPRISLLYKKNNYSQSNINVAIDSNILPKNTLEPIRRFVGSYASPDAANADTNKRLVTKIKINGSLSLDTLSAIQDRLISPGNNDANGNSGSGTGTFILISYADVCFMRAELAARGITTEDAQTFYNAGVTASIQMYDNIAATAHVSRDVNGQPVDYTSPGITSDSISKYLAAPNVVFNTTKALQQITEQAYINYFLQPNEAWALIKRTGYPNATTDLVYETFMISNAVAPYPRRATFSAPSQADDNYANEIAALNGMATDPNFGAIGDNTGRIWWDMP